MSEESEAIDRLAHAIAETFCGAHSDNVTSAIEYLTRHGGENGEIDLMGAVDDLAYKVGKVADAITPREAAAGHDATGGMVGSLTEAVMGMTKALTEIANAIQFVGEVMNSKD